MEKETEYKPQLPQGPVPTIGITFGDPNGIGPETILRVLEDSRLLKLFTPVLYGNHKILNRYRKIFGTDEFQMFPVKTAQQAIPRKVNMVNCWETDYEIQPGKSDPEAGKLALSALNTAAVDWKAGHIKAVVTGPITKANMPADGFPFPGQTEYFANKAEIREPLMLMIHEDLRIALATAHVPVEKISGILTRNLIFTRLSQLERTLRQDFLIQKPKIAVLGLNPHAGENGKLGKEEETVIAPVLKDFRDKGKMIFGPFPADGFFASGQFQKFDGILAMYHDQGLVPFKMLAGYSGVNYTAGLPFIRTSPDHGTAYDIAGKGIATGDSLRSAIFSALDILSNRAFLIPEPKVLSPGVAGVLD